MPTAQGHSSRTRRLTSGAGPSQSQRRGAHRHRPFQGLGWRGQTLPLAGACPGVRAKLRSQREKPKQSLTSCASLGGRADLWSQNIPWFREDGALRLFKTDARWPSPISPVLSVGDE